MNPRWFVRGAVLLGVLAAALLACVEEPTSPSRCPDFCPGGQLGTTESLLATAVTRDSSFQGYIAPNRAGLLVATAEGGVDSRPITRTTVFGFLRVRLDTTAKDTTTGAVVVDSMKLIVNFLRPDTASRNLRLAFYQLPTTIESTTTLADLAPAFANPPLRVVNIDSLLALTGRHDSVSGDTVLLTGLDSVSHLVKLRLKFDSAHAPFSLADSGRLGLAVVVSADARPNLLLGAGESGLGLAASWFYRVDSAGKLVRPDSLRKNLTDSILTGTDFDSFVYTAPVLPPDSDLVVGGVPSTRALLRINLPKSIRDSSQIIRAQLVLVPTATAPIVTSDSVFLMANRLGVDLGAKSPIADTIMGHTAPFSGAPFDTVRIEVTSIFRFWQFDTTQVTSLYVRLLSLRRTTSDSTGHITSPEGATFTTLRFNSSRSAAFRPAIRLTYVPRIKLGVP